MGAPDLEQQTYQYQAPLQMAHTVDRDPRHEVLDWGISVFGAMPVLVATTIGAFVMVRATLKRFGVIK